MREKWDLVLLFILHALFPGFKIHSTFSCSQSSTSEIANFFQSSSAQAFVFPILPDLRLLEIISDAVSPYPLSAYCYLSCFIVNY